MSVRVNWLDFELQLLIKFSNPPEVICWELDDMKSELVRDINNNNKWVDKTKSGDIKRIDKDVYLMISALMINKRASVQIHWRLIAVVDQLIINYKKIHKSPNFIYDKDDIKRLLELNDYLNDTYKTHLTKSPIQPVPPQSHSDEEFQELCNKLDEKDAEIRKLKKEKELLEARVTELEEVIRSNSIMLKANKDEITRLKAQILEKDKQISKLNDDIVIHTQNISALKTDNSKLNNNISALKTDNSKLNNDISVLQVDNSKLNNDISALKEKAKATERKLTLDNDTLRKKFKKFKKEVMTMNNNSSSQDFTSSVSSMKTKDIELFDGLALQCGIDKYTHWYHRCRECISEYGIKGFFKWMVSFISGRENTKYNQEPKDNSNCNKTNRLWFKHPEGNGIICNMFYGGLFNKKTQLFFEIMCDQHKIENETDALIFMLSMVNDTSITRHNCTTKLRDWLNNKHIERDKTVVHRIIETEQELWDMYNLLNNKPREIIKNNFDGTRGYLISIIHGIDKMIIEIRKRVAHIIRFGLMEECKDEIRDSVKILMQLLPQLKKHYIIYSKSDIESLKENIIKVQAINGIKPEMSINNSVIDMQNVPSSIIIGDERSRPIRKNSSFYQQKEKYESSTNKKIVMKSGIPITKLEIQPVSSVSMK